MAVFSTRSGRNNLTEYMKEQITKKYGSIVCEGNSFVDSFSDFRYTKVDNSKFIVTRIDDEKDVYEINSADDFDHWMSFVLND